MRQNKELYEIIKELINNFEIVTIAKNYFGQLSCLFFIVNILRFYLLLFSLFSLFFQSV